MNGITIFEKHYAEYDQWFGNHEQIYQAEINALRKVIPVKGLGIEVGIGTGRFSTPFGINIGVDPARKMAHMAKERNISVCQSLGEFLPFRTDQFDYVLLVTVVCYVKDLAQLFDEVGRVLRIGGQIIIGFIDKDSPLGFFYQSRKESNKFYQPAFFYSVPEIVTYVHHAGFTEVQFAQTILGMPDDNPMIYQVRSGYRDGAFVAIAATKLQNQGG